MGQGPARRNAKRKPSSRIPSPVILQHASLEESPGLRVLVSFTFNNTARPQEPSGNDASVISCWADALPPGCGATSVRRS